MDLSRANPDRAMIRPNCPTPSHPDPTVVPIPITWNPIMCWPKGDGNDLDLRGGRSLGHDDWSRGGGGSCGGVLRRRRTDNIRGDERRRGTGRYRLVESLRLFRGHCLIHGWCLI